MPLGPHGGITIGGTQLSTDPKTYRPLVWEKRYSIHPTIGGGVVVQDFGVHAKDDVIELASGDQNPLSDDVVKALLAKWQVAGATYAFVDWLGNEFTVLILEFRPEPLKSGFDTPANAPIHLFTYTAMLKVTAISKVLGVTYTGF